MTEAIMGALAPSTPGEIGLRIAAREDKVSMLLRRWAGCWIDLIALALLGGGFLLLGAAIEVQPFAGASVAVGLIAIVAYFPVTEGVWGRSLGKLVTGTIVIGANGQLPGIGRVVVRTLFRLVEVNPFLLGGVPAGLFAALTPNHQRLGDIVAGTYVVLVKDLESPLAPTPGL